MIGSISISVNSLDWPECSPLMLLIAAALPPLSSFVVDVRILEVRVKILICLRCLKTEGIKGRQAMVTPSIGSRPVINETSADCLV